MDNIKFIANTTKQNYGFKQTMQNNDVTLEITPIVDGRYLVLTGATISLNWLKPDNELISIAGSSITTSGSNVLVVLPKDCTSVPGEVKFELAITQSNKQVSTFPLSLNVGKSVYQSIVGSTSFATVVQDINEANASASQTLGQLAQTKEDVNSLIQSGGAVNATEYNTDKTNFNENIVAIQSSLSVKANQSYTDTGLSAKRDKTATITLSDLAQEVKTAMTGGSVAVVGENAIDTSNMKDMVVTSDKIKLPWAVILSDNICITVDLQTMKIHIPNDFDIYTNGTLTTYRISAQPDIDISTPTYDYTCVCIYDFIDKKIKYFDANASIPNKHVVLFSRRLNSVWGMTLNNIKLIGLDGNEISGYKASNAIPANGSVTKEKIQNVSIDYTKLELPWGIIVDEDICITLNLQNNQLIFNKGFYIQIGNSTPFVNPPPYIDISEIGSDYTTFCYFDCSDNVIKYTLNSVKPTNPHALLFIKRFNTIYTLNTKTIRVIKTDGTIVKTLDDIANDIENISNSSNANYDELKQRLLLPPKMFFVDSMPLPLYKSSIISNDELDNFKTTLINTGLEVTPSYKYFYDDIMLNPTNLQSVFRIGLTLKRPNGYNYYKDIVKNVVSSTANTDKSCKIICFGDSLTNRNLPAMLKTKLATYGVTATMLGTMPNLGSERGEGRESWEYKTFIGKDNIYANTGTRIYPSNANPSDLNKNPFLKLATNEDKINHPNWCFRNTGAGGTTEELSYENDTDKTGDFYIFDFSYYLSSQSIPVPDIITIALSTNDIGIHPNSYLGSCKLGLEILVKQIKSACPNCKIGIVPCPTMASNYIDGWNNKFSTWIDTCMNEIAVYQETYSGLDIIPVWCHMNRDWNWDYSNTVNLSDTSTIQKATRSEVTHFNENGKAEYVNVTSSWVMNVI